MIMWEARVHSTYYIRMHEKIDKILIRRDIMAELCVCAAASKRRNK